LAPVERDDLAVADARSEKGILQRGLPYFPPYLGDATLGVYMGSMGKDMMAVVNRQLKSYKPKRQPARSHLGFANEHEEELFRALAAVHPITEAGWRFHADEHVKIGTFSCSVHRASRYRLTSKGVRRAVAERLMRDPSA
jgi:hypothetical protein